jgi:hypothetical protein
MLSGPPLRHGQDVAGLPLLSLAPIGCGLGNRRQRPLRLLLPLPRLFPGVLRRLLRRLALGLPAALLKLVDQLRSPTPAIPPDIISGQFPTQTPTS